MRCEAQQVLQGYARKRKTTSYAGGYLFRGKFMKEFNEYTKLFSSLFIISMFTFGGGFVIVPMMQKKFVEELGWIEQEEMIDMVAISQGAPGVISINASIILGRHLAGFKGSIIAALATITPPFIIMSLISHFYPFFSNNELMQFVLKGMQSVVGAIIISVAISMLLDITKTNKVYSISIFVIAFVLSFIFNINVMYIVIASLVISILRYLIIGGNNNGTS
ncbi:MAG: chromate transporter [Erysipelotrichales bacterium]